MNKVMVVCLLLALMTSTQTLAINAANTSNASSQQEQLYQSALSLFAPLPEKMPGAEHDTKAQIALGKKLYFETSLSLNNSQSCNSCHQLTGSGAGVDNLPVSIGALGSLGQRNAPTTWNAGLHFKQFWDGRADTLEQQAVLPLFDQKEMAMKSAEQIYQRLSDNHYLPLFQTAYPDDKAPINLDNIAYALAAFQRTLISRDRFDQYLKGQHSALSTAEQRGLQLFIDKGCVACHSGATLGGQLFMRMGLVEPYPNTNDLGRAHVTGNRADSFVFKAPSLRNVMLTAPYFHDGAAKTIEQAITQTAKHQLGIRLSDSEVKAIKAFFHSLSNQRNPFQ
ncbi:c-type cytochrome [Endozoicomonas sp. G2_1]|uniref:cytochrome-c peroxidase n=1 Tax=Endozoicomonas sp. G2_1 TaxID=2821091 RepID=UPI001ADCEDB6|nr:cytochrome c peroxidase [Endozoicomonas sp. G2_1]MBO9491229.1 c-type cytochrome [Endozoicomonas sp. G2_1]